MIFVELSEREREMFKELSLKEHIRRKIEFALHYLENGFDWQSIYYEPKFGYPCQEFEQLREQHKENDKYA